MAFFEPENLRVSSGGSLLYCAKFRWLLRGTVAHTADYTDVTD